MGGPTCSYVAVGIASEFIGAHKLPHPAKNAFDRVEIPSRGHRRVTGIKK
jgi:hypothetical protein